ncbi:hypothetical protein [Pilimelia columellifera]|uniref:Uncharacterized protein n=1 Tax=Pilimelia columellifera subsp. columellifera TaxID=706583 RepID=A0ABP6ACG3_9ACTN
MAFWNRDRLPAGRRPDLDRDERVARWALVGDVAVVATNRGLWLPGRPRLGWHEINKATWSGRELTVVAAEAIQERDGYQVVVDLPAISLLIDSPGDLPDEVRARVTGSVGPTQHYAGPDNGPGLRVAARRVAGRDGLTWTVRYDEGVDPDGPGVRVATDDLVAAARAGVLDKP